MIKIKPIILDKIVDGIQIVASTEDEPKDPRENWNYQMEKIWKRYEGQFLTEELAYSIRERILSLCRDFVNKNYFPYKLWELHNNVVVNMQGSTLNIGLPYWIHVWCLTGNFMSVLEVQEYLDDPSILFRYTDCPPDGLKYTILY